MEATLTHHFTAHNIRLDDGSRTIPSAPLTVEDSLIFRAVDRSLRLIYPGGLSGKRIADIGCLEGGYATGFARLGMAVTGMEVRSSNMVNCLHVKSNVNLPNLRFVQEDAMNIGQYGPFDVVFVCGLLYHLDQPRRFLEDASKACRKAIILETHFAAVQHDPSVELYRLSETETHEGLKGRWYQEHSDVSADELEQMKWSSWTNRRSFWLEKFSLLQVLRDLGFDTIFEQFDCETDIAGQYGAGSRMTNSRALFVGIRSELAS